MANNPVSYKIHVDRDTRKAVLEATEKQIEVALKMVGSIAEVNASDYYPVVTSFLRNSITIGKQYHNSYIKIVKTVI